MAWNKTPDGYPTNRAEARAQGRRDYAAGYPRTWAANLGPGIRNRVLVAAWGRGWDEGFDAHIREMVRVGALARQVDEVFEEGG